MAVNLLIIKMIAVFIGPTGLGMLGHFMSLTTMAAVFAGGGIGTGITKYVAQFRDRPIRCVRFINSAMTYGAIVSLLVLAATVIGAEPLAYAVLKDSGKAWLMPCFGIAQLLCFIGGAAIAVANGRQRLDIFAKISIGAYLGAIPAAYLLIDNFGLEGAALGLLLTISCTALPATYYVVKFKLSRVLRFSMVGGDLKKLLRFSVMVLASAILFPSAEIIVRNRIIGELGYQQAGIWQATTKLSAAYIGFFSVFLTAHYMPKLSGMFLKLELINSVRKYLLFCGIAFLCFALCLYIVRDRAIEILFSNDFFAVGELLKLQLIGDTFKVLSYVIGFLAVAKAAAGLYIFGEIFQTSLYTILTWTALQQGGGLNGVFYAYIATYFLYFVACLICLSLYARGR